MSVRDIVAGCCVRLPVKAHWLFLLCSSMPLVLLLSSCTEIPITTRPTQGKQEHIEGPSWKDHAESEKGQEEENETRPKNPLRIVTRHSPTTYYRSALGEPAGFEHDLATEFARYLGRPPEFLVAENTAEMMEMLRLGRADFAAFGLSVTHPQVQSLLFGPIYHETPVLLVCRVFFTLNDFEELEKRVTVSRSSVYHELIQASYGREIEVEVSDLSTSELLREVSSGSRECVMADEHSLAMQSEHLSRLKVVFEWPEPDRLAWFFPFSSAALRNVSEVWFERMEKSGQLKALIDMHFGHGGDFDSYDAGRFIERIGTRLPQFMPHFLEAEEATGLNWDLLAAVSYQESHWNPRAKSPTGVRGLMMLTLQTAQNIGVTNRLDPRQSVLGGAKYLKRILDQMPRYLSKHERVWFALAAYNIGYGHLQDARSLAVWQGRNPNSWHEVKQVLPLLGEANMAHLLRYGPARGFEPVNYVRRVRNYLKILRAREPRTGKHAEEMLAGSLLGTDMTASP